MENKALITFVAVICLFVGGVGGWAICQEKNNLERNRLHNSLAEKLTEVKKALVDSDIETLEVAIEVDEPSFITHSLYMAKRLSIAAGGYGAERIQEIENKIKLEHPLDDNRLEGTKQ